jgi:hypothetical protein
MNLFTIGAVILAMRGLAHQEYGDVLLALLLWEVGTGFKGSASVWVLDLFDRRR